MTIKPFLVDGNIVVNEATITNDGTSIVLPSSSTIDGGGSVLDTTNSTTDNLAEGTTNLYFTDARADARIALQAGANLDLSSKSTTDLSEGTNLYYTDARADARIALQAGANLDLSSKSTTDLAEGTNLYYTDARADARIAAASITDLSDADQSVQTTDNVTFANITATGYIAGPATFTIDPAAVGDATGTVVILGDLQVDGTTTTINSTTLDVDDLNITVASGAANAAAADGAGLTVDGASATLTYDSANDRWAMNKSLDITGTLTSDGLTVESTGEAAALFKGYTSVTGVDSVNNGEILLGNNASFQGRISYEGLTEGVLYIENSYNNNAADILFRSKSSGTAQNKLLIEGNGDISFYDGTGTTAKFFWDASAERLGIGTDSPNSRLEVNETITFNNADTFAQLNVKTTSGNLGNMLNIGVDETNELSFLQSMKRGTGYKPLILQRYGGNVGIGTDNPSELLHTNGSIRLTTDVSTTRRLYALSGTGTYALNSSGGAAIAFHRDATNNDEIAFETHWQGNQHAERMRIDNQGNVGIGTSTPDTILEIVSSNPILTLRDTGTGFNNGDATLRLAESGSGDTLGGYFDVRLDASMLKFDFTPEGGSVSTYMAINSSDGNVGIGHTSPDEVLDVKGNFTLRDTTGNLAHGMSVFGDDDQYAIFNQESSGDGGLRITTLSDAASASSAFQVNAVATTVSTDGNAAAIRLRSAKKNGTTEQALADNEDVLSIGNTGTELVVVKGNGNVGIGRTDPSDNLTIDIAASNTGITLSDHGDNFFPQIKYDSNRPNAGQSLGKLSSYWNGTEVARMEFEAGDDNINKDDGAILFNTRVSGGSLTTKVKIDYDGNVGIGTTNPGTKLEVNAGSTTGTHAQIVTTGSGHNFDMTDGTSTARMRNVAGRLHLTADVNNEAANSEIRFLVDNDQKMKIDTDGNVGIGETDPAGKLEVQNTSVNYAILGTSNNGHYFESQSDDNTDGFEIYQQHGNTTTRNSFIVNDNRTGSKSAAFLVRGDGFVGIGTTSPSEKFVLYEDDSSYANTTLLIHNNKADDAAVLKLRGERTGTTDVGQIIFDNSNKTIANIRGVTDTATDDGALQFWTASSGSNAVQRAVIDSAGKFGLRTSSPGYEFDHASDFAGGETKVYRRRYDEVVTAYNGGTGGAGTSTVTVTLSVVGLRGVVLTADFSGSRNNSGPDNYMTRICHALMSESTNLRRSDRLTGLEFAVGATPVTVTSVAMSSSKIVVTYSIAPNGNAYDARMLFTAKGPGIVDVDVSVSFA